jgi:hypothetical protein
VMGVPARRMVNINTLIGLFNVSHHFLPPQQFNLFTP